MRSLAVVALGLALSLVTAGPGMAQFLYVQGKPMEVTTDTVAYCDQLSAQVATAQEHAGDAVPADVPRLAAEGRRLCDHGLIRPGIERLRRAWTMLTVH
jgi:hypothetical protein